MKRERGENPRRYQSLYASEQYPSAKAGHWETEKAGYSFYDASQKTCSDVASHVPLGIEAAVLQALQSFFKNKSLQGFVCCALQNVMTRKNCRGDSFIAAAFVFEIKDEKR